MKFKQTPEDFVVKELLPEGLIKGSGEYQVFALIKRGLTTDHCLRLIAKKFGIKYSDIGFCGMKDKHALTTQHISVKQGRELTGNDFKLRFIGYADKRLQRGDHVANQFIINVKLSPEELTLMKKNEPKVRKGFINYFGRQRLGGELLHKSVVHFLLQGDYQTALLRYYINKSKRANHRLKKSYKMCFKSWPDTRKCYGLLKPLEKNIIIRPLREPDFKSAINKIPKSELELLVAGYQALLWNQNPKPILPVVKVPGLKTRKGKRLVKVVPQDLRINYDSDEAIISFTLPKGSFATILLKALVDESL